jgi:hypothetical protein
MAAVSTCGNDGTCDGNGGCRKYAVGTMCAGATCPTTSTRVGPSTCNASNACVAPSSTTCSPYVCGGGACKNPCSTAADCQSGYVCITGTCTQAPNISVKLLEPSSAPVTGEWIWFDLQVTNNATTALPLSTITAKYWYTWEETVATTTQTSQCSYINGLATGNCNTLLTFGAGTPYFNPVSPAVTGADYSFQLGFTTSAGSLAAGATMTFELGFHKNDWSNYTQTGDYSFNGSTTYATTTKVTFYLSNVLFYGTEPK